MKTRKALVLIIIFSLLTSIFAMSGDDKNEPQAEKNQMKQEVGVPDQAISEPVVETNVAKSGQTAKDEFGIDTGMTKQELESFNDSYQSKFKEVFPNKNEAISEIYRKFKINLNLIDEFEKKGISLRNSISPTNKTYQYSALKSHLIVTGEIVELIEIDGLIPRYKFKIDKIIKGSDIIENLFGEVPDYIHFIAFIYSSYDRESTLNRKGIYFFRFEDNFFENEPLFIKITYSTVTIYKDLIACYERNLGLFNQAYTRTHESTSQANTQNDDRDWQKTYDKLRIEEDWNEIIDNIEEIIEMNDAQNFYKKIFELKDK